MARTNVDIDEEACRAVMARYRLQTKREAINLALRRLAVEPMSLEEALAMQGTGWEADFDDAP
jgi:Arc/MetJ family transcription regulator